MFSKKVLSVFLAALLACGMVPVSLATQTELAYAEQSEGGFMQTDDPAADLTEDTDGELTPENPENPEAEETTDLIDEAGAGDDTNEPDPDALEDQDLKEDSENIDNEVLAEEVPEVAAKDDSELELLAVVDTGLTAGTYVLRSALSRNMVIDIEKGSNAARANARMWASNMTQAQRFEIIIDDKGYATIKNLKSGKVLDVSGGKTKPRTNVWQYGANGSKAQKWIILANSDGTYTFQSALKKGLVLDVAGGSSAAGANLQVYGSNNTRSQKFYVLDPAVDTVAQGRTIADGTYTISTALDAKKVIDIAGGSLADSTTAQIYGTNNTLAQKYQVKLNSRGYYSIRAYHSGKALTVENGNIVPSTRVIQKSYDAHDRTQDWIITPSPSGGYTIMARTGLVLDVKGGSTAAKTPIWLYGDNKTKAQHWNFTDSSALKIPEGVCMIKPYYTSKVLDIAGGSRSQNANVQIYRSNNTLAQRYLCSKVSEGVYTFQVLNSGRYLTENKGNLVQQAYTGHNVQKWRAELVLGGYVFYNLHTGNAMTVEGNSTTDRANVSVESCSFQRGQKFSVVSANTFNNGYYKITMVGSKKAVEVTNGSTAKGAKVRAFTSSGKNEQKWHITNLGNNYYKIANAVSGYSLDVAGGAKKVGTGVRQWAWNATAAQKWQAVPSGDGNFYFKSALGDFYLGVNSSGGVCLSTSDKAKAYKFSLSATSYTPPAPISSAQQAMNNRVSALASPTGWLIAIDSATCKVGVYKGSKGNWKNVSFWSCGPGKASTPTVKGLYSVGSRGYSFGSGYTCYYWTQFYGNYLFHSVLYNQGTRTIQDGTLGKRVSHGCVRLDINNAKWIYDTIPSRTTVLSY